MHLVRKFRLPALFCALAVLVCELVSQPFTAMGICDDWTYIRTAHRLATTGHILYNGVETPILGWQLYLGAAFIKVFGFSLTTVRMSTLLVGLMLAFMLQRTLVRAGIRERNATIGSLAFVLSPLFLVLSVTFMTDVGGLFAIVLCLYGCLRSLQSETSRAAVGWLCFAVATNAVCGSSRQIAWLGILVMIPSAIWLLRSERRVLLGSLAAWLAGVAFVFWCLHWFSLQPYSVPEHVLVNSFSVVRTLVDLRTFLDIPFLLLPIMVLFLPEVRKSNRRVLVICSVLFLGYLFVGTYPSHIRGDIPLEPSGGDWIGIHGVYEFMILQGNPPILLKRGVQVVLTILSFGGVYGLISSLLCSRRYPSAQNTSDGVSWKQLGVLLGPFTVVYSLLLIPRAAAFHLTERYFLALLVIGLICIVRFYQERIRPQLPLAGALLVAVMAVYGIVDTHNTFAIDRARVKLAAELRADGAPDEEVDNGWEYNLAVELRHAPYLNDSRIVVPANAYVPTAPGLAGSCPMNMYDDTPHIHPIYGISFDPNACDGPAPFIPVHYSRWPYLTPGTLYVVRYTAPPALTTPR